MKRTIKKVVAWGKRFLTGAFICATVLVCMAGLMAVKNAVEAARVREASLSVGTDMQPVSFTERYTLPELLISYRTLPAADISISRRDQKCLGSLMHGEAGNQSKVGKYAAGFTVVNRAKLNRQDLGGNTICGVVYYKTHTKRHGVRWQYNGAKHPPRLLTEETIEDMELAADILRGRVQPEGWLKDALYFKAPYAKGGGAQWFVELIPLGFVDGHQFYTEKSASAKPVRTHVANR